MGLRDTVRETYRGEMRIPFGQDEYRTRIDNVKKKMLERNINLLYCSAPTSMYYLIGYQCEWYQGEEPYTGSHFDWLPCSGVAVRADKDELFFFDRTGHETLADAHVTGDNLTVFNYSYKIQADTGFTNIEYIINTLKQKGWLKGVVGFEKASHRPNPVVSGIMEAAVTAEGCKVINGSDIVRDVKDVKSPQELSYHRTAAKFADIGYKTAVEFIRPGVTEMEVKAEILHAMTAAGSEDTGIPMPVLSGPARTSMAHAMTSQRVIIPGDMIFIDICGVYNRYHSNLVRPISVGEPHPDVRKQIENLAGGVSLMRKTMRPGLVVKKLTKIMREYYKSVGIWDDRRWCGGYELGPAFAPSWIGSWVWDINENDDDERIFVPGNVTNHEAQSYLPRAAGAAYFIDTVMFEQDDADMLTEIEPELLVAE